MELILNDDQLQQFDTEGWLFFENVFDAEEIALLNAEAHRISPWTVKKYSVSPMARRRAQPSRRRTTTTPSIVLAGTRVSSAR